MKSHEVSELYNHLANFKNYFYDEGASQAHLGVFGVNDYECAKTGISLIDIIQKCIKRGKL